MQNDIRVLEGLTARARQESTGSHTNKDAGAPARDRSMAALAALLGEQNEHAVAHAQDLLGGFGPDATGWAKQLYDVFHEAVAQADTEGPWLRLRDATLKLGGSKETRGASLVLLQGLIAFQPPPPPRLAAQFPRDLRLMRANGLLGEARELQRQGATREWHKKIKEAIEITPDDAQREALTKALAADIDRRRLGRREKIVIAGIVLVMFAALCALFLLDPRSR